MDLLNLLLSDWVGRLSLFTVVFATGMMIYLAVYFALQVKKADREAKNQSESTEQQESDHLHQA